MVSIHIAFHGCSSAVPIRQIQSTQQFRDKQVLVSSEATMNSAVLNCIVCMMMLVRCVSCQSFSFNIFIKHFHQVFMSNFFIQKIDLIFSSSIFFIHFRQKISSVIFIYHFNSVFYRSFQEFSLQKTIISKVLTEKLPKKHPKSANKTKPPKSIGYS